MTIIFTLTCHVHVRQTLYGTLKQNFLFVKFHLSSSILFIEIELEGKCMLWGGGEGGGAKLDLMPSSNAGGVN